MNARSARLFRRWPVVIPRGLTMVELLVTLTIISILASTVLFAMAAASESAKHSRTRVVVARLHALLMERWDSYLTRRAPVSTVSLTPAAASTRRLAAIRELMLMEMPDRWAEVVNPAIPNVQGGRTALSNAYLRRYQQIKASNPDPNWPVGDGFQNAECLYLVISIGTGDGEALEQFSQTDIGDVDGDGAPEFLDGWGRPIRFLRWPAEFVSELQPLIPGGVDPWADRDPVGDHDPFDPMKIQAEAYRLVPLIYSAGPDEGFDVLADSTAGFTYDYAPPPPGGVLDPYEIVEAGVPNMRIGRQRDLDMDGSEEWHDNIHNHLIGLR